jgi:hypothetical protein
VNLWECGERGCPSTATGTGSAEGLRAIGWLFEPGPAGPRLLCPIHHPGWPRTPRVDRDKPTRWKYSESGEAVPLWHALDTLACHWRFGYYHQLQGKPREPKNANPEYRAAQLAGWDAAQGDYPSLEVRGAHYAEGLIDQLLPPKESP